MGREDKKEKIYEYMEARIPFLGRRVRREEERKIEGVEGEVFDWQTLLTLYKLMTDGTIEKLEFPISAGKEAVVFRGTSSSGFIAIKIYCISNRTFRNIGKYILGDPRFSGISRNPREVIHAWARKEFKNLDIMYRAGAHVPKPIRSLNNVLVMEYIGTEASPAPLLKDAKLDCTVLMEVFNSIISDIRRSVEAGIVHGDLSEYNIVITEDMVPVIIDVGQGVVVEHPNARKWLQRDVHNIVQFFSKRGIEADEEGIFREIEAAF